MRGIGNIVFVIVGLVVLLTPALATEYSAVVRGYEYKADNKNSTDEYTLNLSESWTFAGLKIKYSSLDSSRVWFSISGDNLLSGAEYFKLSEDTWTCLKGNTSDSSCTVPGSVKLKFVDLFERSISPDTSASNYTSDSPVYGYATLDGDKLIMTRNGENAFDAVAYSQRTSGWTSSTKTSKVYVYFKRVDSTPFSVSVTGGKLEPAWEWSSGGGQIKYTLTENVKYTFTVKYDMVNPTGKKEERVDTYALTTRGLDSPVGSVVAASGTYDVVLGNSKTITMSELGKFTSQSGVSIAANGDREYSFSFTSAGQYRVKYTTSSGGETFVDFNVREASAPTPTVAANQKQEDGGGDGSTLLIGGVFAVALAGLGIVMYRRKNSRGGGGRTHYTPKEID